jgi:hypothetical protein
MPKGLSLLAPRLDARSAVQVDAEDNPYLASASDEVIEADTRDGNVVVWFEPEPALFARHLVRILWGSGTVTVHVGTGVEIESPSSLGSFFSGAVTLGLALCEWTFDGLQWIVSSVITAGGGGGGGLTPIAIDATMSPYAASPNEQLFVDVSLGSVVINMPTLAFGAQLSVKHGDGDLSVHEITVNAAAGQDLEQPAGVNPSGSPEFASSFAFPQLPPATGLELTWINGGIAAGLSVL